MTNLPPKKRKNSYRSVFRQSKSSRKSPAALAVESFLLLLSSSIIFYYLQIIPYKYNLGEIVDSTLSSYTNLLVSSLEALKGTAIIFLIIFAAIICILLFIAFLWRIIRLISKSPRKPN